MEMTFLQNTECYNNQIIKNWEYFGYSIYGGIQKDLMCSFRKEVLKKPENPILECPEYPKLESPGSPLFCQHHTSHSGLIGMEFNSLMVEEDSNCKKRWCRKNDKIKMTVFLNIQAQRKWIDSVLDGIGVHRAKRAKRGISEQSVKSTPLLYQVEP
jgi:hypothetical protein